MLTFLLIEATLSAKLIQKTYKIYVVPSQYKEEYGAAKIELYNLEKELDYLEDVEDATEGIKNKHVRELVQQYYRDEYEAEKGISVVTEDEVNAEFANISSDVEVLKLKIRTNTNVTIDFNQLSHPMVVEESGKLITNWAKEIREVRKELREKQDEYDEMVYPEKKNRKNHLKVLAASRTAKRILKDDDYDDHCHCVCDEDKDKDDEQKESNRYPTATFLGGNITNVTKISFEETQVKFIEEDFMVREFIYDGDFTFQNDSMKIAAQIFVIEFDDLIERKIANIRPMLNITYFVVDISELTEKMNDPYTHFVISFEEKMWGLYKVRGNERHPIISGIENNFTKGFGIQSYEKIRHISFELAAGAKFHKVAGFVFIRVDFSRNTTMELHGLADVTSRKQYDYARALEDNVVTLSQEGEWDQVEKPKVTLLRADGVGLDNQLSGDWLVEQQIFDLQQQQQQQSSKGGLSGGAIAGIVIACVVVCAAIVVVAVVVVKKKQHHEQNNDKIDNKEEEKEEKESI